jgi:hypothetical protein
MQMSLCILARNGHEEAARLIESVRQFRDLELEVCIGDQSSDEESTDWYLSHADVYTRVTDRELWDLGFGYCKQKVVDKAASEWAIIGDVGEVWHENLEDGGLVRMIEKYHPPTPCFRVMRGEEESIQAIVAGKEPPVVPTDDNGRVILRREMGILGMIHEAPFHRWTREVWARWARQHVPVAWVEHPGSTKESEATMKRKDILYDHLVYTIVHDPPKRLGTNRHWWTTHWEQHVRPRYTGTTFEEWSEMEG